MYGAVVESPPRSPAPADTPSLTPAATSPRTREVDDTESWTIGRVLRWTQARFTARGLLSPRLDAELLLAHGLGRPRVALYTHFDQPLQKDELARYRAAILQRLAGMPVAYLIGEKEFYGLTLRVTQDVLIPRPETELLVEKVLERLTPATNEPSADTRADESTQFSMATADLADAPDSQSPAQRGVDLHVQYDSAPDSDDPAPGAQPPSDADAATPGAQPGQGATDEGNTKSGPPAGLVVEVGTGSGAVALAIKHSQPGARVVALDRSPQALAVAQANAQQLGLSVEFLESDLLARLPGAHPAIAPGQIDAIAANLPYIPHDEIAGLSPEVRSEPHLALDGGADGLDLVRRLIDEAAPWLRPGGMLALEIGHGQHLAVEGALRAAGYVQITTHPDLAGIQRVVTGDRPADPRA